jgi:hypothetical protein
VSLFDAAQAGKFEVVASALTLLEVLVVPYRAGNIEPAERYEAVLTRSRGIRMVDLTAIICAWRRNCARRPALPQPTRCSSPFHLAADAPHLSQTTGACRPFRGCASSSSRTVSCGQ